VPATAGAAPGRGFLQLPICGVGRTGVRDGRRIWAWLRNRRPSNAPPASASLLELALVKGPSGSRRWREQVERYHYLGCRVPFGQTCATGASSRAGVRLSALDIAGLEDASSGRVDRWSDEQRTAELAMIVNQRKIPPFLPWIRVKGLASKILALSARQLPHDWETSLRLSSAAAGNPLWMGTAFAERATDGQLDPCGTDRRPRPQWIGSTGSPVQAVKDIYVYPLLRMRGSSSGRPHTVKQILNFNPHL